MRSTSFGARGPIAKFLDADRLGALQAATAARPGDVVFFVCDKRDVADALAGKLRVKLGGGSAGHNGLRSLTQALKTPDYLRVRIGIGRPPGRQDPADFVLEPIGKRDEVEIAGWVDRAADAVRSLIGTGLAATQDRFNGDAGRI